MPGIIIPEYPYGHPKNEDTAYDKWRCEMDEKAADAASYEFEKWFNKNHPLDWYAKENGGEPMDAKDRLRVRQFALGAYLAAREATARRCVEICATNGLESSSECLWRIKQEFGL